MPTDYSPTVLIIRTAFIRAALFLAFAGGFSSAQTAGPVIPAGLITKVPFTITKPGLYLLRKDLVLASASATAITIHASGVTLDLGGHTLSSGAPLDANNQSIGVSQLNTVKDITLRNGTLKNFNVGADLSNQAYEGRVLMENLVVEKSGLTGLLAIAFSVEIRECHVLKTGYKTTLGTPLISAAGVVALGTNLKVVNNEITDLYMGALTVSTGIKLTPLTNALVANNVVSTSTAAYKGIVFESGGNGANFAVENTIVNFAMGLDMSPGGKYRDNFTKLCTTPFIGGTPFGSNN